MAWLEYIKNGERFTIELLRDREYYIGRDLSCSIALPEYPFLSRRNSVVYYNSNTGEFSLGDMHSTNGTRLNGEDIGHTDRSLKDGDVIGAGPQEVLFRRHRKKTEPSPTVSSNTSKLRVIATHPLEKNSPAALQDHSQSDLSFRIGDKFGDCIITDILMENEQQILCLLRSNAFPGKTEGVQRRKVLNVFKDLPSDFSAGKELTNAIKKLPSDLEGILHYQESGTLDNGLCFYTAEYLDAPSFAKIISISAPMPERRVLPRIYAVAQILDNAAEKGVIHGQLTPAKILYCPRKYDLIIGMGLGAWRRKYYELASYPSLWYASPELFREQPLTWQSDLYSLGIIFFQMLSGVLPFRSGDPAELAEMHCQYPLPEISERNPRIHISRLLYSVLIRMTMKDPALRYSSWKEFMKDLARVNEQLAEKK